MRSFVVEAYLPAAEQGGAESAARRLRDAATAMREAGAAVTFESGLLLADDELVLFLFRSRTSEAVAKALMRASVRYDRIAESVAVGLAPRRPRSVAVGVGPRRPQSVAAITTRE